MRLANKMGSISKMKDKNRRKPWRVRITERWEFDENLMKYRQIQKTLGCYASRQEAMKALSDYLDAPFDMNVLEITFDQCYQEAKKDFTEGRKHNYMAAYKYFELIKNKPIRSIKASEMQRCIDSCQTTQQQEIKTVAHKIYDYALKNEIVDKNPSQYLHSNSVDTRREREVFTLEQIKGIEEQDEWWSKITIMLLYSGMRTKELKTLDPENIDIENKTIDIKIAKNKSSVRQIPIHSHIIDLFADYKEQGCNLYGFTHDGLNKALKAFCGHTAHDSRHTFTTRMRECGADPLILQKILGHAPQTITERVYTHLTLKEMSSNLEKLNYSTIQDKV